MSGFEKRNNREMKLLVFGTGEYYQRFKKWLVKEDVAALLDNSPEKQNTMIDGIEVLSPEEGVRRRFEAVVIMSFYVKAMKEQLIGLGVEERFIYHFYDLRRLIDIKNIRQDIQYYGISKKELNNRKKAGIALLSTDLALGGTAIALFYMARTLKKLGHSIVFISMMDGPLRERLEEQGISVVIDSNLQLATMRETEWMSDFGLLICNTINYYIFLSERDPCMPVIWWLHDSSFFYDGVDREMLRGIPRENLITVSVGPVPEKAIHEIAPDLSVGQLLYGVEDCVGSKAVLREAHGSRKNGGKKICFVTIGHIEERKGQDILLRAVSLLEEEERQKAVFYLVGQDTSLMAAKLKENARSLPEVIVTGPVGREEIDEVLNRADVIICPSREDPMPTVAAEAMMHGVPCILSDAAGTAAYITEGKNGFVFSSGNVLELEKKIRWCIDNYDSLAEMGKNARKIYEERFSMDIFEKNMSCIMERFADCS